MGLGDGRRDQRLVEDRGDLVPPGRVLDLRDPGGGGLGLR